MILALDLGQQTGWALRSSDGLTTSGTVAFKPGRFEGGGMPFLRFRHWLTELKQAAGGIEALYLEEVRRHAGTSAAHVYGLQASPCIRRTDVRILALDNLFITQPTSAHPGPRTAKPSRGGDGRNA